MSELYETIAPHNSTVLGYPADGPTGKELWARLRWTDKVFVDGKSGTPHFFMPCADCEYLHVPAIWDGEEVSYRVRPNKVPGNKHRGKVIKRVKAVNVEGAWRWVYLVK